MNLSRRKLLQALSTLPLFTLVNEIHAAPALLPIRINIPGPNSLPFAPIELIPLLGIDRKLGAQLIIRYFPSGVRGLEDVLAGNAHFAGLGFSVLPVFAGKGQQVRAITPLSGQTPPYAILVRQDLVGKIRHVADLKGRSIGVSTGSVTSKTYLQMAAEVTLASYGVKADDVRWVPTAQNFDGLQGALSGLAVDAVFCEEPFVSELVDRKAAQVLVSLSSPDVAARIPGGIHLRATIATSGDLAANDIQRCEIMARMVQHAFAWMHQNTPETIIAKLNIKNESERRNMVAALAKSPGMYSADGLFSRRQVEATLQFLRAASVSFPANMDIHSLVMYQWSEHKP